MLLESSGRDSPGCLMAPLPFMTGFEYGSKSTGRKGGSARKPVFSSHRPQPMFRVGPVEDTFSNRRTAGGPIGKGHPGEDAAAHHSHNGGKAVREDDSILYEHARGQSGYKQEGSVFLLGCRGRMEQADSDGCVPSPRSILDRLDSPPPSPPWALQSPEGSETHSGSGSVFGGSPVGSADSVDLPTPPPPIHTSLPALKKSPYSAELRTEYAPFNPEPLEKPGLGDRCKSYTSLPALDGTPSRGLRRSKSSVDCRLRPPLPRPGIPRVASVIDSYTPKTLEQFLETENEESADLENCFPDSFPEELCTPDMMTRCQPQTGAKTSRGRQNTVGGTKSCARLVLRVNNQVPSILDFEDMMVPV